MESSVFTDKSIQPDNDRLSQVLGEKGKFWEAIKNHIKEKHCDVIEVKHQEDVENVKKLIDIKVKS